MWGGGGGGGGYGVLYKSSDSCIVFGINLSLIPSYLTYFMP